MYSNIFHSAKHPLSPSMLLQMAEFHRLLNSSVESLSNVWLFANPWTAAPQPPCPSPTPGVYSNSCPLSQWCHPTIWSSVIPFSSCLQSFQHQGFFLWVSFFASGGQRIGASASSSVLPMNVQDRFPLGWTGLISLLSKGLSRVFSNTALWKLPSSIIQ